MSKTIYTRVLIWITESGFVVVGYHRGTFVPVEKFADIGDAARFAITLPVRNPDHPINIIRSGT